MKYGDLTELYGVYIDEELLKNYSTRSSTNPEEGVVPMTQSQYNTLLTKLDEGYILVTKDAWTSIVNHGHCCIVDDVYSSGSVYVVEAFGPDTQSDRYQLGVTYDHWRKYNRVRVYYPTSATSDERIDASEYAWSDLQGWDYDPFADIDSSTYLNCATLVWKAYESENIELDMSLFVINQYAYWFTVYPRDIVEDADTTLTHNVNWSGSAHTW